MLPCNNGIFHNFFSRRERLNSLLVYKYKASIPESLFPKMLSHTSKKEEGCFPKIIAEREKKKMIEFRIKDSYMFDVV